MKIQTPEELHDVIQEIQEEILKLMLDDFTLSGRMNWAILRNDSEEKKRILKRQKEIDERLIELFKKRIALKQMLGLAEGANGSEN